jgi:hypothetical protein
LKDMDREPNRSWPQKSSKSAPRLELCHNKLLSVTSDLHQTCLEKNIRSLVGTMRLSRPYYYCEHCHHGIWPWDEILRLSPERLTPGGQEIVTLLGTLNSFGKAAERVLEKATGLRLSESTVERTTEGTGERLGQRLADGVIPSTGVTPQSKNTRSPVSSSGVQDPHRRPIGARVQSHRGPQPARRTSFAKRPMVSVRLRNVGQRLLRRRRELTREA